MSIDEGVVPVLIVGAGPVGLTAAIALRRLGVDCRIIDADDGPTPPEESRALGVQARTMEVFRTLGVADRLLEGGVQVRQAVGYRGRRPRFRIGMETLEEETAFPFILSIPQGETERILLDRLEQLGGRVEWGTSLTDVRQDAGGVIAELRRGDGPSPVLSRWLVGCDGSRSVVRERLGIGFEGASYPERFLLADVEIRWTDPKDRAVVMITPEGVVPAIPLPGDLSWRLIDTTGRLDSDDPGAIVDRFRAIVRDHAPDPRAEVVGASWTSRFRVHRKAATRFRLGRCLLAGDSAHVHSPVGGQGMNTGIQDAFNLSWKLAMVVGGETSDAILDSYDLERRPVAETVLSGTDRATRLVTIRNPILRHARDRIVPAILSVPAIRRRLARGVAELDVSYRSSPLSVIEGSGGVHRPTSAVLTAGDRLPDPTLKGGGRLVDHVRGPWFTLLIFTGTAGKEDREPESIGPVLDHLAEGDFREFVDPIVLLGPGRLPPDVPAGSIRAIEDPGGGLHRRFEVGDRGGVCLVRPDNSIGFVGRSLHPASWALALDTICPRKE